jgi:hypothetical protein
MKRIILFIISIYCLEASAQEIEKNSLSTSLIRLETNSQTIDGDYNLKFMTGIEYQRFGNKWSFGIKYEHGFNKIEEYPTNCADCFYGTGYMREDNIYLTTNYSILNLFNSRLKLNTGASLYYSNLNFSGDYQGGFSGGGTKKNSTYNTLGVAPSLSILYYPIERLFISVNSNLRYGWSKEFDANSNQDKKVNEFVITAPELKIGVNF